MAFRAYLLLDIVDDQVEKVVQQLQNKSGVVRIDLLEGSPDVFVIVETSGQKRLTELALRAFASIKDLAGEVRLMPVKEKSFEANHREHYYRKRSTGTRKTR